MARPGFGIGAVFLVVAAGTSGALAQTPASRPLGPCEQITAACERAGFVLGGAAEGNGLYQDCLNPLMQGRERGAAAKPLPIVDGALKAACLAAQPRFGQPAGEPAAAKASLNYTASAPAVFMTQQEMRGYRFQWGPADGQFGAIPLGQGRYRFLGGAGGGQTCPPAGRKIGVFGFTGTLDRVTGGDGCAVVLGAGEGPRGWLFDANYAGGGQVIRFAANGKSGWLMSFRGEYWWKNRARPDGWCDGGSAAFAGGVPCYYSTLGLAVSTDDGRTFKAAGESLQLTDPLSASKGGQVNRNIGYGSLLVADANGKHLDNPPPDPRSAYIYLMFVSSGADLPGACTKAQCPGIARARYEDVVAAVLSGDPHAVARLFRKYDAALDDPWSQPATGDSPDLTIGGGRFSPLYLGGGPNMVVYDRAFDVYLGAVITYAGRLPGLTIRTSTDLIHWSDPIGPPITDGKRALSYITLLGETGDPTIAGAEPRLYFRSTPEGKPNWQDAVFKVVKLRLSRE
jgi:hypothetical protein